MAKCIKWNEIKADYLNGITPSELSKKYDVEINKIYKKVENDKWAKELREIKVNLGNDVQERIKELTNLALETLCNVINDPESDNKDKVSASKAILDVSGLKSIKQDVTGINPTSVIINREAVLVEANN